MVSSPPPLLPNSMIHFVSSILLTLEKTCLVENQSFLIIKKYIYEIQNGLFNIPIDPPSPQPMHVTGLPLTSRLRIPAILFTNDLVLLAEASVH